MANRRRKNLMIIMLCTVLVFMGIGYAVLSQTLTIGGESKITGKWSVFIQSITPTTQHGKAVSKSEMIKRNKTSASFIVDLYDVGDYVEYTVVVKNGGNIPAILNTIETEVSEPSQFIQFTTTAKKGDKIKPGQTVSFIVKIAVVNENGAILTNSIGTSYNLQLNYIQSDDGAEPNPNLDIPDSIYVIATGNISETANDNVTYTYYNNGNIVISGNGAIKDYIFMPAQSVDNLFFSANIISQYIVSSKSGMIFEDLYCDKSSLIFDNLCPVYELAIEKILNNMSQSDFDEQWNSQQYVADTIDKPWLYDVILDFPEFKSLTIESGITKLGSYMFFQFPLIQSNFAIPDTVTEIGNYAFSATKFSSITLPNNSDFISIPKSFCGECLNLTNINIPNSVTTIGDSAFNGSANLSNVTLSNNLISIGNRAFEKTNLSEISLPDSLTTIGNYAFRNTRLTSLTIPANLTTIGDYVFPSTLTTVILNGGDTTRFDANWSDLFGSATKVVQ